MRQLRGAWQVVLHITGQRNIRDFLFLSPPQTGEGPGRSTGWAEILWDQQPWNDVHCSHPAPPMCGVTSSCTCAARPQPELSCLGRSLRGALGGASQRLGPSGLQTAGGTHSTSGAPDLQELRTTSELGLWRVFCTNSEPVVVSSPLWTRSLSCGVCLLTPHLPTWQPA